MFAFWSFWSNSLIHPLACTDSALSLSLFFSVLLCLSLDEALPPFAAGRHSDPSSRRRGLRLPRGLRAARGGDVLRRGRRVGGRLRGGAELRGDAQSPAAWRSESDRSAVKGGVVGVLLCWSGWQKEGEV